jgi:hypothetical protein
MHGTREVVGPGFGYVLVLMCVILVYGSSGVVDYLEASIHGGLALTPMEERLCDFVVFYGVILPVGVCVVVLLVALCSAAYDLMRKRWALRKLSILLHAILACVAFVGVLLGRNVLERYFVWFD